jgi:hypothetical protein
MVWDAPFLDDERTIAHHNRCAAAASPTSSGADEVTF